MFKLTTFRTVMAISGVIAWIIVFGAAITQGWDYVSDMLINYGVPLNK